MKFLFIDIETAPMASFHWSPKTRYISDNMNYQETTLLMACWKLTGQKKIKHATVKHGDVRDDSAVVEALHDLLLEAADQNWIIVYHNGDRFDLPKIKSRVIYYALPPIPELTTVDTLKSCRGIGFDYRRLDWLDKYLNDGGKVVTRGWPMWEDIVSPWSTATKRRSALKEMLHYNKGDVLALERVFDRLRPHMNNLPNMNLWQGSMMHCPSCGGHNIIYRSKPYIARTRAYRRMSCNDCGKWFREVGCIKTDRALVR